jgi:hypothetical protein
MNVNQFTGHPHSRRLLGEPLDVSHRDKRRRGCAAHGVRFLGTRRLELNGSLLAARRIGSAVHTVVVTRTRLGTMVSSSARALSCAVWYRRSVEGCRALAHDPVLELRSASTDVVPWCLRSDKRVHFELNTGVTVDCTECYTMYLVGTNAPQRRTTDTTERCAPAFRNHVLSQFVLADDPAELATVRDLSVGG